ncbi:hypothetical protein [Rhizobium sp. LjRoot254]|uniref:hypothetical protein n=1 Tax=Rhizobium sp. LjRoot254 TaxID=3342297 RepID=UPI003ED13A27
MKKFLITIIALIFAATSFVTVAEARSGMKWRNGGNHHGWNNRGWRGHNRGYHNGHGYNNRHGRWYRHHRGHRHHGRYYGGWYGGYWGPGIVIAPGYDGYDRYDGYEDDYGAYQDVCFVRKVRRYDRNGRAYIRRVRVCE